MIQKTNFKHCFNRVCWLTLMTVILFGTMTSFAQTTGSLTGVVTDEQGAAIAGANISVVSDERKRIEGNTQTTDDGNYNFPSLIPGNYKLVVERNGFSRSETSPVIIELNVRQRVDVKLAIGKVDATVTVTLDEAQQIERDTSGVGTIIGKEQVQNLPLFERSPTNLIGLAPGVSAGSDADGRLNTAQLSVNGSRTLNSEVTVDGVSAVNGSTGDVSFVPSVESLREFRVQTATYSAEFGRTSGATVSAVVSSGTDKYRGSLYEYFRNEALNANNYFNNSRSIERPTDRFNQFGGTIGGPIPFLNFGDGGPVLLRGKSFFFFNYEGLRRTVPRQFTSTVPTQAFRNGDFSASLGSYICRATAGGATVLSPTPGCPTGSTAVTVTDTANSVVQARIGQLFRQSTVAANRLAYAGNIVPQAEFDPAARALIALLPLPNLSGDSRNYFVNSSDKVDTDQGTFRIDHNFTENARAFVRYSLRKGTDATFTADASEILPGVINPGTTANTPVNHQFAIGYSQSLTPTIFNEFTFGFNRDLQTIDPPGAIESPSTLGFQSAPQLSIGTGTGYYAPAILFPGGNRFGYSTSATAASRVGINGNTLRRQNTNTFQISDSFSIIRGSHTIKTGFQIRRNGLDIFNGGGQFSANYTINGDNLVSPITQIASQNTLTTQFAAFLLGKLDSATYQIPQPLTKRRNYNLGFFVQDDWKVTPRLTLNLGLRYDVETPLTIASDVYSRIDTETGRLLVAGVNASRSLNLKADKYNFGPRVGFAYSFDENTVIRAAYGLFYSQVFSNLGGSGALYPGFTITQQFNRLGSGRSQAFSLSQGIPLITATTLNPFTVEQNASPTNPLVTGAQFASISPLPEVHQWSLGVQRVIPFSITLDAAYVGTRATHLPLDSTEFNSVPEALFEQVAAGNNNAGTQAARRFPNVGSLNAFENVGSSFYNSAQFKVTRRFSQGFGITANYTFSKSIDDGSGIYNFSQPNGIDRGIAPTFRRDLDRSVSSFDRPHVFTAAIQFDLPFGKGKWLLNDASSGGEKFARAILGGWRINLLTQARSGLPDTIALSGLSAIGTQFQPRPNSNGQSLQYTLEPGPNGTVRYIQAANSANFPLSPVGPVYVGAGATRTRILPFSYGTLGRNTVRAPSSYNTDLSLIRRFKLGERMNFNVRAEAFNLFNQTTFLFDPAGASTTLPVIVNASNQAVFDAPSFGLIDRALAPRRLQLVARFEF
jgi:hypothetical protein